MYIVIMYTHRRSLYFLALHLRCRLFFGDLNAYPKFLERYGAIYRTRHHETCGSGLAEPKRNGRIRDVVPLSSFFSGWFEHRRLRA